MKTTKERLDNGGKRGEEVKIKKVRGKREDIKETKKGEVKQRNAKRKEKRKGRKEKREEREEEKRE